LTDRKIDFIYNNFGEVTQFDKLAEECAEYLKAYHKKDVINIIEEAGDVYNVARGIYNNNSIVKGAADIKIERTIERIDGGYYDDCTA